MAAKAPTKRRSGRKRGHGEGSIVQIRSGRWRGALMVGYRLDGKPDRRWVSDTSRAAVQRKLQSLRQQVETRTLTEPHSLTVEVFFAKWLRDIISIAVELATISQYESLVRMHVVPHLGRVKLAKLRPSKLQALYA